MPKTIIITGASSGIGNALAQWLAKAGHHVIAVARNEEALQELHALYPANIKPVTADITKPDDRKKIQQSLPPDAHGIYLVHNAGIAIPSLLANLTEEEWEQHYLVNTKAPFFLTQLLLPQLKNGGRILNISTGLAHQSLPGLSAYGISKAAFYMMKEYFNAEYKDQNIVCGSAMPGVVDTPIQAHLRERSNAEFPAVDLFHGFQQRDELLSPKTVAKFLTWLLFETENAKFIVGDWDINDTSHQQYWAQPGEVKQRHK
jgi:NAD(P)-dependent dehydrogenase (short-subunit alcohol dehydrogenase family)